MRDSKLSSRQSRALISATHAFSCECVEPPPRAAEATSENGKTMRIANTISELRSPSAPLA
ncbi:Hypothetical predicted protein [Olea europaea subsp. europaea]|uniref:Uncharacterized protein n=1 Tax=Olea europaea subsp. europaea TaxID=158383 RepID=A0A8S0TNP4_OLEEU|nr:Hypothetical predicted protein [Olea europaea subsp. europaea]